LLFLEIISTLVCTVDLFAVQRIIHNFLLTFATSTRPGSLPRERGVHNCSFRGGQKGWRPQAFFLGGLRGGRCSFLCLKGGEFWPEGWGELGMGGGAGEESKYCTLIGRSPRVCMQSGQLLHRGCFIAFFFPVFQLLGFSRNIT
jgi:hypothetical protein